MNKEMKRELIAAILTPAVFGALILLFMKIGIIQSASNDVFTIFFWLTAATSLLVLLLSYWLIFKRR